MINSFTKNKFILMLFLVTAAVSVSASAQSMYLDYGDNGVLLEFNSMFSSNLSPQDIGVTTGFSVAGVVDVGFTAGVHFLEINETDSASLSAGGYLNALILKQGRNVPLSIQIRSMYGLENVVYSPALDEPTSFSQSERRRTGRGFIVGLAFLRNSAVTDEFGLHTEIFGEYQAFKYSTRENYTRTEGATDLQDELHFGGKAALIFTFSNGTVFSPGIRADLDFIDLDVSFGPHAVVVIPTR